MESKQPDKLMPFIMAATNSACMSFVMCLVNIGFHPPFWPEFLKSFLIGLAVTVPISYILPVLLNRGGRKEK